MLFVLFLDVDRSTVQLVRKFSDLVSARKYLEVFDRLGSVNYVVTSYDMQTILLKSF